MKTVVVLFVLVLTLIGGEAKKAQEDTCKTLCLDKKLKEPACKESCALNKRFKTVWIEAVQCSLKCSKKHGIGSPAAKSCDEGCKKKGWGKGAGVTARRDVGCRNKGEKDPLGIEKCKKICTPALIYKEIREA